MKQNTYLAISLAGMGLAIFSMLAIADYSDLLTGFIMGIGLSMSAFATYKLLLLDKGKAEKERKAWKHGDGSVTLVKQKNRPRASKKESHGCKKTSSTDYGKKDRQSIKTIRRLKLIFKG